MMKMTYKLFLGEGFLTIHDMNANGFDAHTANAVENLTRQKLYAKYGDQSPSPEIHAGFRWIAARELGIITEGKGKTKTRLDPKCWKGYKKQGTKMKGGVKVNNCVKESKYSLSSAKQYINEWGNDHEDGATAEEVASAIARRLMHNTDLLEKALKASPNGIEGVMNAIDSVAEFHAGAEELGSSDISIMVREVLHELGIKESTVKERSLANLRNRASFDGRDKLNQLAAKAKVDKEKEKDLDEVKMEDWRVGVQSIPRTEKFKLKKIVVKTPGGKTYTFDNESEARRHFVDSWERIKAGELDGWFVDLNNTKEYNESSKSKKKTDERKLKRMVGMESMIREYAEAGYFTK